MVKSANDDFSSNCAFGGGVIFTRLCRAAYSISSCLGTLSRSNSSKLR